MSWDKLRASVRVTISCVILLLISPTAIYASSTDSAPVWALKPPGDNVSSYYGVGSGRNKSQAQQAALADIASRWGVTISTDEVSEYELSGGQTREAYVATIKAQVRNTDFSQFNVVKAEQVKGWIWVLVEVDRSKMINDLRSKMDRAKKELERDFVELAKASDLEQAKSVMELQPKLVKMRTMVSTLSAVDSGFDAAPAFDDISNKMANLKQVGSQIEVRIENDDDSKVFARDLARKLNAQNIKIVKGSSKGNTVISIASDVEYHELMEVYYAKMSVDIQARDGTGKVLATNIHQVTGASPTSDQAALQQANEKLTTKLEEEGLLESIGL